MQEAGVTLLHLIQTAFINLNCSVFCFITACVGGGGRAQLVPGSHKRYELGCTVICHKAERIWKVIPVTDSLWNETAFVS